MASKLWCCVPNCNTTQQDGTSLHVFPNPDQEPDRFQTWRDAIGGNILALDNQYIYKQRRVCHKHFETKYCTWRGRIVGTAVPRLHLTDINMDSKNQVDELVWLNEPKEWEKKEGTIEVTTDEKTDFWQGTWYNFHFNTGHVYGKNVSGDFRLTVCVEADFKELYDQAGVMLYVDEKHWVKSGIEYNDGQPMIGSVVTKEVSDWGTGVYSGNPKKFYIRLNKAGNVVCIKYSTDKIKWILLRLCEFPVKDSYFLGVMCCTPTRKGLIVKFSDICYDLPEKDMLHGQC